jgi:hypothetical protein
MPSASNSTSQTQVGSTIDVRQHAARLYRIITADEEIIERTGEQIVQACKLQMNVSAWRQNFDAAVERVGQWCRQHADHVSVALVTLRSNKIVFYVIPISEQYDFDLGEAQADLDIYLNTRGAIGYAETRQIPGWEMERFVPPTAYRVFPTDEELAEG